MTDKHFVQLKTEEMLTKKQENIQEVETPVSQSPTSQAIQRALDNPSTETLTPDVITALQTTHGNQFVQNLAGRSSEAKNQLSHPIQMKMSVTPANDHYEQEADNVAKDVVNQINSPDIQRESEAGELEDEELMAKRIQRESEAGELEDEELMAKRIQRESEASELEDEELMAKRIQRESEEDELMMKSIQRASSADGFDVEGSLEERIETSRGSGQTMDESTRNSMENAFGSDFTDVNIHTGSEASDLSNSIQARAFTTGTDIYFNDGEYQPGSSGGQELLAHELTHVVQQGGAGVQKKESED